MKTELCQDKSLCPLIYETGGGNILSLRFVARKVLEGTDLESL